MSDPIPTPAPAKPERICIANGWSRYRAGDVWHIARDDLGEVFEIRVRHCQAEFDDLMVALAQPAPDATPAESDGLWKASAQSGFAALRMVREAVEAFGPATSLESPEAVLLRGPEPTNEAEAIIEALGRLRHATPASRQNDPLWHIKAASRSVIEDMAAERDKAVEACDNYRRYAEAAETARDTTLVKLERLRSYAASVWFDEATATDEEHELMRASR